MWKDPIVEEIHKIREKNEKKFNFDIHAICEDFRKKQRDSSRKVVKGKPKKVTTEIAA